MTDKQTVYSFPFFLLCLSSILFMGSFNMIIPELPAYLTSLGGAEYKGFIISFFTITAGLSRPFSGKLADTIGRMPIMVFGVIVCIVIGVLYPLLASVSGFLFLRLIHGFSTGFKPTATTAYLADIVPDKKRGEALGYLGVSGSIGMAAGPAFGSFIANNYSIDTMFYCSSVVALASILILAGMKETLPERQRFHPRLLKISAKDVFDKNVVSPSIVMLLTTYSFGTILTVIPDFSDYLEISNRGLFFTFLLGASIVLRLIAGRVSDVYGRKKLLMSGSFILAIAMGVVAFAQSQAVFFGGAVIMGIAVGINSPTVFAWTVDLAQKKYRGRAMATMFIALEIGVGVGAFVSGELYANQSSNFPITFLAGSLLSFLAFLYLLFLKTKE